MGIQPEKLFTCRLDQRSHKQNVSDDIHVTEAGIFNTISCSRQKTQYFFAGKILDALSKLTPVTSY